MRRRVVPLLVCGLVVAAGLAVRATPSLPAADKLGDVLYAALAVLGLRLLAPGARPRLLAALGLAWCWAVEVLQLTALPDAAAARFGPSRLVLGAGFDPLDLLAYAVGVGLAAGVVAACRAAARRSRHTGGR